MRKVELRMKENQKYEVIKELVDHNGNKNRAAKKLSLSTRQINRLIAIYKEKGKSGFIHGNRGRNPSKTLDKSISEDIITLYKNKYYDFNFYHFKDFLEKKITFAMSEEQIENIISHEIALEDSHPRGEKPKYFGEIIEQDGSIHLWFGGIKSCLHLAIDKATSTIVGAWFDKQETLNGYYHILFQILTNYGIPYKFLTDNRTVFNYMSLNPNKRTSEKDVLTQYGYACKRLGIELETTSVSQAKGLIERTNGTFQGRLVQELRLNNITTIDEANKYLTDVFVPNFNKKFALDYHNFSSVFETAPALDEINYFLAVLTPRKIDNGNSIKFQNKYYQPYLNNELKCFSAKTECLVINAFDGSLAVSIDDKIYELKELSRNEKFSKNFDEVPETVEKKKYIPPMDHPYKAASFKKYQEKQASRTHIGFGRYCYN